jgi:ABC-type transport system involved in multi-copper enzyme maturation permease subunit
VIEVSQDSKHPDNQLKSDFGGEKTIEPGGSLIWLIARKEIMANIRNFKTPVALVIMTLLLLLSAHVLALDYRNRLNNWSVNLDSQSEPIAGGRISYDLSDGSFSHGVGFSHPPPIQPPEPFSALIKGMDGEMDRTVSVSQRIVIGARNGEPATSSLFDTPDTSFVVKLLVSLFALMFSLDAAPREKESGTLRAMLAQPIRRRELILSKSLGTSISLLAPFAIAYFVEIIYLHLAHGLLNDRQDLVRAMLIFGFVSLYGIVFAHIGLFISTITTRTRIAITTALLTWATIVLILPNASVLMAKLLTPTPSYNQLNARLREARMRVLKEDAEENSAARTARPSIQSLPRIYEIERQETDNYIASKKDQNRRARLFATLSPAGAVTFGLSDLAGTGMDAYNSYLDLLRSSRDVMLDALKRSLNLSRQEGDKLMQEAIETAVHRQRRAEPLGASLRSSIIPITSLLAWAVIFGLAACWRFKRYDVR